MGIRRVSPSATAAARRHASRQPFERRSAGRPPRPLRRVASDRIRELTVSRPRIESTKRVECLFASALLYALFAVSGFCGLIYESIWAKYVKLFLGHAAYAQTVVLVVFIGGMAIGAALCGRFAQRIRHPLIAYAVAEFGASASRRSDSTRTCVAATDWAYSVLLPSACDASGSLHCVVDSCRGADPAAVDPPRHDVSADDRGGVARSRPAGRGARSRCSISSTASAPSSACSQARSSSCPGRGCRAPR